MSETTTDRHRNDTTMMYAVHDAFQRDLDGLTSLAEHGATGGPAVRAGWERFTTYLHIHHTAEDTHLWPVLRAKVAGRPAELALLDQMETEHTGLTSLLDTFDAALAASAPQHRLAEHARRLADALTAHCDHEEGEALPLVAELLTAREWEAFGAEQRRQLGISWRRIVLPLAAGRGHGRDAAHRAGLSASARAAALSRGVAAPLSPRPALVGPRPALTGSTDGVAVQRGEAEPGRSSNAH